MREQTSAFAAPATEGHRDPTLRRTPFWTRTVPVVPVASPSTAGTPGTRQRKGCEEPIEHDRPDNDDDTRPNDPPPTHELSFSTSSTTTTRSPSPHHVTEPTKDPARTLLQVPLPGNLRCPSRSRSVSSSRDR